ncbi:hypothetical protein O0I10_012559 [Lichtheimia ornata]|uniref:Reverse transcriptase n=1 Tax=Lichtheimia ornata TaxID=688661 RepID=A0AAD7UT85_9FUNG|nr:uncharacterized protein O0I10_012559 [Lichtheimia ornata]KAJ8651866.1 hypothetical protein O0I10_012559 [Lichtheimia ornata]
MSTQSLFSQLPYHDAGAMELDPPVSPLNNNPDLQSLASEPNDHSIAEMMNEFQHFALPNGQQTMAMATPATNDSGIALPNSQPIPTIPNGQEPTVPVLQDQSAEVPTQPASQPVTAMPNGAAASIHADPLHLAKIAYKDMKDEVAEKEKVYSQAIISKHHSRHTLMNELKQLQDNLEMSRLMWKAQHPQHVEFYSHEEIEALKRQRASAQRESQRALIVPKNLPALQLPGTVKWNPRLIVHPTAAAFIRAFEAELGSYGLTAEKDWERLIFCCLSDTQQLWLKNRLKEVKGNVTWDKVANLIIEKYDTNLQRILTMLDVLAMQQGNQALDEYCDEFQQRCLNAGLSAQTPAGLLLVIIFLSSLSAKHHEKATTFIVNQFSTGMPSDLDKVLEMVRTLKLSDCGSGKRKHEESSAAGSSNPNKKHQGHKQQQQQQHHQRQHTTKESDKPTNRCDYCNRTWRHGHKCSEYYAATGKPDPRKKQFFNRSAKVNKDADDKMDTLPCKSKTLSNRENKDEVLTPITIESHNIMALVDGGANFSALDVDFVKRLSLKIYPVQGTIGLASNEMSTPRIGITDPLNVVYNGRSYQHRFEVMNLARKHPMSIGWDLMHKMGIGYVGLATSWTKPMQSEDKELDDSPFEPNASPAGSPEEMQAFMDAIQPILNENANIRPGTFCNIPESIITLDTPKDAKCYRRQYEFPLTRQQLVEDTVADWLKEGIITEVPANIDNGWNSPLTFAPKKDAKGNKVGVRLCLDPRHINKYLPDDRHPIPLVRTVFDQLAGSSVFSTLDLKSAFHRFQIHEKDRHKTTFTSASGKQYMFVGCPFGLKPISAKFQRVMQILFTGLPFVTTFVDDIVVSSKSMQEHTEHVRIALERLTKANLLLNPDKCHFAQKAVYLLGFRVSAAGRALDSRKVTNVLEWPSPRTGKDIQRFLGIVNYFRDHIPNVSRLTARLDALRHAGDLKGLWTKAHENAFANIKYSVSHAPMLKHVNLKLPFHLATDASNDGIGAVLYQKENGRNTIVGFMARALTKSERNYSVTKRELLAIVFAFNKFHKFLWGNPFTLYTDHKPSSTSIPRKMPIP